MRLIERLHAAVHQGREAAGEGFSGAPTSLEEAQSRIRRKMRVRPRGARPALPVFVSIASREPTAAPEPTVREQVAPEDTPEERVA